ncbi:transcription initiation factor TFIID subunit 7-like [Physella acuta]|uniref:transcription initiation factor TFIID subunit 7-like n=1 Tax=Physella acuta TaxID=109671 RepID=UPI0027DD0ECC|nr:transcription initiation factor TFIID subunit 7-like [Physella acuta]XP_059140372.1 transcription initiation factor TFIID subunit 7-like [Physella acuta]XP_059140373.1 transcription initiation factor TFIID subunit 7-like [Physella acuta]XP_059140374.1 transcription initiation factor TFIID subunit 7-like [Physella acuta]XP_059140376.1 transcription initiation factor TFIID subunit 7-like [Physella acuta]XP_059140377.1 transcription initiation factor TFIID subunit 7-like [Physella acuta]XP_05
MSSKTKKKEPPLSCNPESFDLEQQFILRLPQDAALQLHEDLKESSNVQLRDKLSIEMDPDMRHGRVRYGGDIFFAKLLDLPTIVESLKTVDKKTFYKTADICQMLLCKTEEDWTQDETESPRKKDKDKKYAWNHGITPPLKNVRKRRFRKTLKKKYMDQPEVEKEVRRLFRYDSEAIDVKFEIIVDDEKSLSDSGTSQTAAAGGSKTHLLRSETQTSMDVASFFGDISSSEEDDDDEKDVNIMDSGEEDMSRGPNTPKAGTGDRLEGTGMTDHETAELLEKLKELEKQLEDIRERRSHQEDQLATLEDDAVKEDMQAALNKLVQEETEKEREIEMLSALLNQ